MSIRSVYQTIGGWFLFWFFLLSAKLLMAPLHPFPVVLRRLREMRASWWMDRSFSSFRVERQTDITSWSTGLSVAYAAGSLGVGSMRVSKSSPDRCYPFYRLFGHYLDRQQRLVLHAGGKEIALAPFIATLNTVLRSVISIISSMPQPTCAIPILQLS